MPKIYILGLGAGSLEQLPLGVYRCLQEAKPLYLRTKVHPVVEDLKREGIAYTSFDDVYERHEQFEAVYQEIVTALETALHTQDTIYYAVPGHPLVAEQTVQLLLKRSREKDYELEVVGGQSFLDPLFTKLGLDPVEGFQLLDATTIEVAQLRPSLHTVITQVYNQFVASELKLTLMEVYPDEFPILVATAIGVPNQEKIIRIPLYKLDRVITMSNLTCVYLPSTDDPELSKRTYFRAREIVCQLRGPAGCPWDKQQTHQSLKKYLLEETEEVLAAIDAEDPDQLAEELGDLLLQIFMHAQIAEEEGYFTMEDVLYSLNDKMIRRHPHVFGDRQANSVEEVKKIWAEIKQKERE